jgi:hypothetical protein
MPVDPTAHPSLADTISMDRKPLVDGLVTVLQLEPSQWMITPPGQLTAHPSLADTISTE